MVECELHFLNQSEAMIYEYANLLSNKAMLWQLHKHSPKSVFKVGDMIMMIATSQLFLTHKKL